MFELIQDALGDSNFRRMLAIVLLTSVSCGVLGTFVVTKKITSLTGGISHAAFGGVGLAHLLRWNLTLGAIGAGLLAGTLIGLAHRRLRSSLDTVISMVWAVGMALGLLFVNLAPGRVFPIESYLFGNLLFADWSIAQMAAGLDVLVLVCVVLFYKELQAVCFDEEFAEVSGVRVEAIFLGLLALTSLAIVALIKVVGVILAIALLTVPAAVARQWSSSLPRMMVLAVLASAAFTSLGLFLAYGLQARWPRIPAGAVIILVAVLSYGVSSGILAIRRRRVGS